MRPTLKSKLYDFQTEGKNFCIEKKYSILGFEVGLGKTITALAVACEKNLKTLVVCPAYLKSNWEDEISKHTTGLDVTVLSYNRMAKMTSLDYDLVICDEAQYLKNIKAKRTERFHELISTYKPEYLILASGTPIKNRVSEFFSLLQLCYYGGLYDGFSSFHCLYYKFCNTFSFERTFEVNGVPIVRFDGVRNVDKLKELIAPVYIRKKTKDVIDLPDTVDIFIKGECKRKYAEDLEEAFRIFEQDPKDPAYMSLKRANAVAKYKHTLNFTKDLLDQDEKVVVFTDHVASALYIAKDLNIEAVTGSMSPDKRGQVVRDFESNKTSCIVATIGSLSTGVNLTSANRMIFNDLPFVPTDLAQAKARIYRIGQEKKCFYYYTINSDFDIKLKEMLDRKNKDIGKVYE